MVVPTVFFISVPNTIIRVGNEIVITEKSEIMSRFAARGRNLPRDTRGRFSGLRSECLVLPSIDYEVELRLNASNSAGTVSVPLSDGVCQFFYRVHEAFKVEPI